MEILKNITEKDELIKVINTAIDGILKKEDNDKNSASEGLKDLQNIISQYCSQQLTKSEMLDYFPVSSNMKDCILKVVEARKMQICNHLINFHNCSQGIPLMTSFDWNLKYIMGNSSLESHRELKATLTFECHDKTSLSVEMGPDMIDKMIDELENISSAAE